jgi:hypothetical protein
MQASVSRVIMFAPQNNFLNGSLKNMFVSKCQFFLEIIGEHGYNKFVLWSEYLRCGRYDIVNIYLLSKSYITLTLYFT